MQTFDTIYQRLLSKATQRFHRPAEQLDKEHRLFLDWAADELSALYREMGRSRDYIQRNILQKLKTEIEHRPRPVHALAQAHPKKQNTILKPEDEPFTIQRMSAEPPHEIYFTALRPTPLVDAQVKFRVSGNTLEDISNVSIPKDLLKTQNNASFHQGVLWWGIELADNIDLQSDLHFHVSLSTKNHPSSKQLYDLLPLIQWYSNEQPLNTEIGFGDWFTDKNQQKNLFLDTENLFLNRLETEILDHYKNNFVTLDNPGKWLIEDKNNALFPNELLEKFDAIALSEACSKQIIWIKMVFPSGFSPQEVSQTQIQLNCFPIINRKLDKSRDRTPSNNDFFEIIPLTNTETNRPSLAETGDFFLGMQKLFSKNKGIYRAVTFENFENVPAGYYALQADRVEMEDLEDFQNKVKELIHYLKPESNRLKNGTTDTIKSTLFSLEEGIEELQQELNRTPFKKALPNYYLHVKLLDNQQVVYVQFWVTQGEYGKGILKKGEVLRNNESKEITII